jgi:hydrogenase maturation factor
VIADRATVPVCDEHHCITCGDDGDPMTVVRVDADRGLALCADEEGARHTVETALVEPVVPGDRILVHAGTAIAALASRADESEAAAA